MVPEEQTPVLPLDTYSHCLLDVVLAHELGRTVHVPLQTPDQLPEGTDSEEESSAPVLTVSKHFDFRERSLNQSHFTLFQWSVTAVLDTEFT